MIGQLLTAKDVCALLKVSRSMSSPAYQDCGGLQRTSTDYRGLPAAGAPNELPVD